MRTRWGVLISGNGSTLQALLDCRESIDVTVVISSKELAYGIRRAMRAGVPCFVIPPALKGDKVESEKWILAKLNEYRVQSVFLAGYMRILSGDFIKKCPGPLVNIHPSLLPKYKGAHSLAEALQAGEKTIGVTTHHVVEDVDSGGMVIQRQFTVPNHRNTDLCELWLHIQEQRVIRESLRKIKWAPT